MVRIVTPRGIMREVEIAFPVVEKRFQFNKQSQRLAEAVHDQSSVASGIMFEFKATGSPFDHSRLFVGNLRPEKVKEIMQSMLMKGNYDFNSLKYQGWVENSDETVFDEGQSEPYASDFVGNGFTLGVNLSGSDNMCGLRQSSSMPVGCNMDCCGERAESDDDPFSECRNVADEVGDIFRNESIQTGCNDIFARNEGEAF